MSGSLFRGDLVRLLEDIAGPDWHRQSPDPGSDPIRPDPSGRVFHALFAVEEIQEIQDAFARATGVASIITTTEGVPITRSSNFCTLCRDVIRETEKGRVNCFRSDAEIGRYNPDGPIIQTCLSGGLWDAGASITAGRIHIANWLIGQVRNEYTDLPRMKAYAREIGADEEVFLRALEEVTLMSTEQFLQVSRALFLIANQMSQRAYQNLQLTHTIAELGRAEGIINRSPAVAFHRKRETGWPVTFVTENVEQLLGYSSEEFLSGRVAYQDALHPEDAERVQEVLARNIRDKGVGEFAHEPYRVVTRSGDVKWVEHITRVIRNEEGEATEFEGIVIDISERKRMETEKAALESQLQRAQKMELVGTLAGGVAHDLNNILGAIVGYPDMLLLDLPEESPLRKPIEAMRRTGERAADIVQDLLTLARRSVVVKDVSNLNDVVTGYLESPEHMRLLAAHPNVETVTDLETDLLNILGSRSHLSKTVMNVVTNAAEAMPGGGTIRISTENVYLDRRMIEQDNVQEGDYAVLKISDQGEGISPEDTERIFEPFYTKKTMGKSGTGLGMAVVWGTVKDHKGYITVESTRGKGTCFHIYFPVTRRDLPLAEGSLPVEAYQGHGERILVIDDVAEQRNVASALLDRLGYSVSTVSSGEEALEYLEKNPVDLLLLDMIMDPGWNGLQTYKKIVEKHPGQKAVIASGFSETHRVREAQKLGAGPYIKKPYTLAKLGVAVRNELAGRRP